MISQQGGAVMARTKRKDVFSPDEIAIVHVMNRTTRRCFLFGDDTLSGKNYDHRKVWFVDRLQLLASQFGIDLLSYAVLSNHFHLILRSRPDVVKTWDDTEVARRWLTLCPLRKDEFGNAIPPTEFELNTIRTNKTKLDQIRRRLSDISWWMRLLCQNIAQRANLEENETGKFFQARFKATRLLDETSLLACAAYVDLNFIRAALAETLEGSQFTSIQKRIEDLIPDVGPSGEATPSEPSRPQAASDFLAPVDLDERSGSTGPCAHQHGQRCSDKGFLPMTTAAYVELLDWTARQIRGDKRGSTPMHLAPIFERLGIHEETWVQLVREFGRLFYVMAGQPKTIDSHRSADGTRRFRAKAAVRELLASA
jgi:hypothetical protein